MCTIDGENCFVRNIQRARIAILVVRSGAFWVTGAAPRTALPGKFFTHRRMTFLFFFPPRRENLYVHDIVYQMCSKRERSYKTRYSMYQMVSLGQTLLFLLIILCY